MLGANGDVAARMTLLTPRATARRSGGTVATATRKSSVAAATAVAVRPLSLGRRKWGTLLPATTMSLTVAVVPAGHGGKRRGYSARRRERRPTASASSAATANETSEALAQSGAVKPRSRHQSAHHPTVPGFTSW